MIKCKCQIPIKIIQGRIYKFADRIKYMPTNKELITNKALEILSIKENGLRLTQLIKEIKNALPQKRGAKSMTYI